jgi:hypothetical protein
MRPTAMILGFKGKELKTLDDVRVALSALLRDISTGDVSPDEAQPIHKRLTSS